MKNACKHLARFLKEREYVELKRLESMSTLEGTLAKMTPCMHAYY